MICYENRRHLANIVKKLISVQFRDFVIFMTLSIKDLPG